MRKLYITLLFLACSIISHGQSTEKFRGTMPTRIANGGEVTYYYLSENESKVIKHGRFSYRLRQTRGFSKIYQDVSGNYVNGWKDGSWSFRTTFKDYKDDRGTEYLSGNMTLTAEYEKGKPTGSWRFKYSYKTREIEANNGGRIQWENYNSPKSIVLNFKINNLKLVDSLYMATDDGRGAEGVLDENGFFTGNWNIEDGEQLVRELYDDGLMYKQEIYNKQDTLLVKAYDYSDVEMTRRDTIESIMKRNPKEACQLHYTLDTISVFRENHTIKDILGEWIFDNPYLLFRDLDGDNYDPANFSGGYMVRVVNQVTPDQKVQLNELENLHEEFKQVNIRVQNMARGKSVSDRNKSTMQLMTYFERTAEKYSCLAKALTSKPDFKDAAEFCQKACINTVTLTKELPEFTSRKEALTFMVADLKEKAETMRSYENMLRKELAFR